LVAPGSVHPREPREGLRSYLYHHDRMKNRPMGQQELILKRATRITPSGELKHDDYDVLCGDKVVGGS